VATGPGYEQGPSESLLWEYVGAVLRRRRFALAVFAVVATACTFRSLLTRPVYLATAQLLIERDNPQVLSFKEVAEVDAARDDYYQTQYKLLQSRALARRVVQDLKLLEDPAFGGLGAAEAAAALAAPNSPAVERAIDSFLSRLRVQPVRNSRLVAVGFHSGRPDQAAQIANRVAQLYIQRTLESRYETSAEAGQWLAGQIEDQRRKVEAADLALQKVKEAEGIVNLEERRTLLEQKLKELGTALTSLKTERLQKEALYGQMRRAPNAEELPEVMRSPVVQSLRIELANLERQQAQLMERRLEQHPDVVKVRNQIQDTRRMLHSEGQRVIRAAENDYKASSAQEASVAAALEAAKGEALDLSRRSVNYDSRKREVDAAKEVLDSLLSRHKQTDVAQELKSSNIQVADPAPIPRRPIRPRPMVDIPVGLLYGLLAGAGLAVVLHHLDNRLRTPEDVKNYLGVPLLGIVPTAPEGSTGAAQLHNPRDPFAEAFRVLRTSLIYCWPERLARVVVVTSTAPGEGKTLLSVRLAVSLASAGDEVLLIDADLRKPRAHELLKTRRGPGLADALVGRAKLSDTIRATGIRHLSFLPSGTSVPSPADLLTVQTTPKLLDGLRGLYRWIVIDTPPLGAVPEAMILGPLSDGVMVVAAADGVRRNAVRVTVERLTEAGARILGVVLNRAEVDTRSGYYGHYYGGAYGYSEAPARAAGGVARIRDWRGAR
jgi:succinoglycan biosynthesis transport protein ExoP